MMSREEAMTWVGNSRFRAFLLVLWVGFQLPVVYLEYSGYRAHRRYLEWRLSRVWPRRKQ